MGIKRAAVSHASKLRRRYRHARKLVTLFGPLGFIQGRRRAREETDIAEWARISKVMRTADTEHIARGD